jgi:hypothetical protein
MWLSQTKTPLIPTQTTTLYPNIEHIAIRFNQLSAGIVGEKVI